MEIFSKKNLPTFLPVFLLIGACLGSFYNLITIRIPKGESIISPRSKCDHCEHSLSWKEKIPIISWFLLKGFCSKCNQRIAIRNPIIESISVILFGISTSSNPTALEGASSILISLSGCIFFSILLLLSIFDVDHLILPRKLCYLGIVSGLVITSYLKFSIRDNRNLHAILADHFLAALIGYICFRSFAFFISFILRKQAIGLGDGYLIAMLGSWLGATGLSLAVIISILSGGSYCSYGLLKKTIKRGDLLPFGPFLCIGGILVWTFGNHFWINFFIFRSY